MAELGSYYITIMPSMKGFSAKVKSEIGDLGTEIGNKTTNGFLATLKGSAIGVALGNLASRAGNAIMDGISVGIKRLDTIENFPKVMESLGYSSDEASKSIKTIMDHLDGLPTATQDMVTLTQAISDSTGDLDLATRAALGFNDMMLANGASSAEVATAQGVLNRVLGKGSATAAQWQSLCSVMPAQLGVVAKSMLGAGSSTEDLHAALEDGTVSWNDFLRAIADLDKNGYIDEAGNKIGSFEEQARANSHGIGTAIDNIKNRIGAGWAEILKTVGREDISSAIDKMSYGVRNGMYKVAEGIGWLKDKVANTKIGESLEKIFKGIGDFVGGIGSKSGGVIKDLAEKLIGLTDGALQWLADHGDLVIKVLEGMAVAFAFKKAAGGVKFLGDIGNGIKLVGDTLPMVSKIGDIPAAFKLLTEAGGPLAGIFGKLTPLATSLSGGVEGVGTALSGVALGPIVAIAAGIVGLVAVFKTLWDTNEGFRNAITGIWDNLCQTFAAAGERMGKVFETIGKAFSGIGEACSPILDRLGELWKFVCNLMAPAIVAALDSLASVVGGIVTVVTGVIETIVGLINGFVTGDFTMFTEGLKAVWDGVWSILLAPVKAIFEGATYILGQFGIKWEDVWNGVKSFAKGAWDGIKSGLGDMVSKTKANWDKWTSDLRKGCEDLGKNVSNKWSEIKSAVTTTVGNIASGVGAKWTEIKTNVGTTVGNIAADLGTRWEGIKTTVGTTVGNIATSVGTKWTEIKTTVGTTVGNIATNVGTKWSEIKSDVASTLGNIASNMSNKWQGIKSNVSSTVESIKSSISSKFQAAKSAALGVFDGIRNGIRDKIQWAKDQVSRIVDGIKGLFSFSWSLPAPKLPHIDWHWEDIGGVVSLPMFDGISWYKKGGVFDSAALIGIGEAGKEAALPLNRKTYGEIARGIRSEMPDGGDGVTITGCTFVVREEADIDRVADALARKWRRERMA